MSRFSTCPQSALPEVSTTRMPSFTDYPLALLIVMNALEHLGVGVLHPTDVDADLFLAKV
jgi:hypothetical protein